MRSLSELQKTFLQALLNKQSELVHEEIAEGKISAERRLQIYTNNVYGNLTAALEAVYPVVERLIGVEFFQHVADEYIARHPSDNGDIHHFGAHFPRFLITFRGLEEYVYLPDTARLEWLIHESFHSADADLLSLDKLALVKPDDYGRLKLIIHPACKLFVSIYPIKRIWEINQPDYGKQDSVSLDEGGVSLLLCRPRYEVELMELELQEHNFISMLAAGVTFGETVEQILQIAPDFNAAVFLQEMAQKNVIVDFLLSEEEL
jgi:hypothetical protein